MVADITHNTGDQFTPSAGSPFDGGSDFDKFINLIPDPACVAAIDGCFLKINHVWENVLGYTQSELMRVPFLSFIHPDDIEKTRAAIVGSKSGETISNLINRYRTKKGDYRWFSWNILPATNEHLMYGTARDITNQIESENLLTLVVKIHSNINKNMPLKELLPNILNELKAYCQVSEVNIRLNDGAYFQSGPISQTGKPHIKETYKSHASLPLILHGGETIGQLQINDTKANKFSPTLINCLEELNKNLAVLIERKKAEEALKKSEERLRNLFYNSSVGMVHFLPEGTILRLNTALAKMGGYSSAEELLAYARDQGLKGLLDMSKYPEFISRVLKTDGWLHTEVSFSRKDQQILLARVSVRKVLRTNGTLDYLESLFEDITERKKAEEALKESEERFRRLFHESPLGMAIINRDYSFKGVNQALIDMLGYTESELLSMTFMDITHPDYIANNLEDAEKLARGEITSFKTEKRYISKNKSNIWASVIVSGIHDSRGNIKSCLAIIENITQNIYIRDALQRSETRYRSLVDSSNAGVCTIDTEGNISYANAALSGMLGYANSEFMGKPFKNFLNQAEYFGIMRKLIRVASHADNYAGINLEFRVRRQDGSHIWLGANPVPLVYLGKTVGYSSILIDISERKKVEQELRHSQEQLHNFSWHLQEMMEAEKRRLSSEIHDELGQMLTGLKIGLAWIARRLPPDSETLIQKTKYLSTLVDEADGVVKKIAADLRPVILDNLGLSESIKWLVEQCESRSGIKCQLRLDPENIELDPDRSLDIFRVVQEALNNITRHSGATRAVISLKLKEDLLKLTIQDNGRGVNQNEISGTYSFGLTGMQERARRWQGTVKINGVPNKGTIINFRIPVIGDKND